MKSTTIEEVIHTTTIAFGNAPTPCSKRFELLNKVSKMSIIEQLYDQFIKATVNQETGRKLR